MSEREKVLVILGAGASYDSHLGATPVVSEWRPPLAPQLFRTEIQNYSKIAARYPRVDTFTPSLAASAKRKDFEFEKKLLELSQHANPQKRRDFRYIPLYIRDLIWTCSYNYAQKPDAQYLLIDLLFNDYDKDVCIIDLNYDDFIERALLHHFQGYHLNNIEQYVRLPNCILLKLHGSIRWFKQMGVCPGNWTERVEYSEYLFDTPVSWIIDDQVTDSRNHNNGNQFLYPIITAPMAGKGSTSIVCPGPFVEKYKAFVRDCRKVLMIGCSFHDEDLHSLLRNSMNRPFCFFPITASRSESSQIIQRMKALQGATMVEFIENGEGFRGNLENEEIERFLKLKLQ